MTTSTREDRVGAGLGVVRKYQELGRPLTTEEQSALCRELENALADQMERRASDPLVVLQDVADPTIGG